MSAALDASELAELDAIRSVLAEHGYEDRSERYGYREVWVSPAGRSLRLLTEPGAVRVSASIALDVLLSTRAR